MTTFPAPYCAVGDLLIARDSMVFPPSMDPEKIIASAAREMTSKLGFLYAIPLEPTSPLTELPQYQKDLLTDINAKLATGRMLTALHGVSDDGTHAYGLGLIREAEASLIMIANGDIQLDAEPSPAAITDPSSYTGPSVTPRDDESLLLGWENTVLRSEPWQSYPGATP